jgi:hypothetical protein
MKYMNDKINVTEVRNIAKGDIYLEKLCAPLE